MSDQVTTVRCAIFFGLFLPRTWRGGNCKDSVCRARPLTSYNGFPSQVNRPRLEISMWLEQLSKLLEKLAVSREVAGRIFPLHLVEQCARTL
jgi:hypothetical protein